MPRGALKWCRTAIYPSSGTYGTSGGTSSPRFSGGSAAHVGGDERQAGFTKGARPVRPAARRMGRPLRSSPSLTTGAVVSTPSRDATVVRVRAVLGQDDELIHRRPLPIGRNRVADLPRHPPPPRGRDSPLGFIGVFGPPPEPAAFLLVVMLPFVRLVAIGRVRNGLESAGDLPTTRSLSEFRPHQDLPDRLKYRNLTVRQLAADPIRKPIAVLVHPITEVIAATREGRRLKTGFGIADEVEHVEEIITAENLGIAGRRFAFGRRRRRQVVHVWVEPDPPMLRECRSVKWPRALPMCRESDPASSLSRAFAVGSEPVSACSRALANRRSITPFARSTHGRRAARSSGCGAIAVICLCASPTPASPSSRPRPARTGSPARRPRPARRPIQAAAS